MSTFLNSLKPSALLGMQLALVLLLQAAFCSTHCGTYSPDSDVPCRLESSYGIGSPLVVTTSDGVTTRRIRPAPLALNLAASYGLAALLAGAFRHATGFRRPTLAFLGIVLAMVAASFVASITLSRMYWGYYRARPSVLEEVADVASVRAVIPIETETLEDGTRKIVPQTDYSIAERLANGPKDPYYCLDERLLLALDAQGLLPRNHSSDLGTLPPLHPLMQGTGLLASPKAGYHDSDLLHGVVIDALGKSGKRLVFVGATGCELSNDHYPYYELLFTGDFESADSLSFQRGQRFFFDVAGIEGAEWHLVWPFLALLAVVAGSAAVAVSRLVWRRFRDFRR